MYLNIKWISCSFYPIYPSIHETCLDIAYKEYFKFDMIPDILIMPSDLTQGSKHMTSDYTNGKMKKIKLFYWTLYLEHNDIQCLSNSVFTNNKCMYINPGRLINYCSSGVVNNSSTSSSSYVILTIKKNEGDEIFNVEDKCDVEFINLNN